MAALPTSQHADKQLNIAINGFGRIGRNVLRAYIERIAFKGRLHESLQEQSEHIQNINIVAINDVADPQALLHLLKYDSAHGRLPVDAYIENSQLCIVLPDSVLRIHLFDKSQALDLPWQALQIDMVLECSGKYRSRELAGNHITAGAGQVVIGAAPFDDVDACIVYGINHQELTAEHKIISSVSCTTQALVPLMKLLDKHFGVQSAMMTEIHAVTADQCVLDSAHRDLRRARAAGHNIIPTTSSSLGALQRVLPNMAGKVNGLSIRVPSLDVAAIDITAVVDKTVTREHVNAMLVAEAQQHSQIMAVTHEPLVSSDFVHEPQSLIVDSEQTMVIASQVKVFAWYDNEWGYANRLLDICLYRSRLTA